MELCLTIACNALRLVLGEVVVSSLFVVKTVHQVSNIRLLIRFHFYNLSKSMLALYMTVYYQTLLARDRMFSAWTFFKEINKENLCCFLIWFYQIIISKLYFTHSEFNFCSNMLSILTFRKANASCVLDKPHINHHYETLTHDLPGQIYNTSEQCRQIYGTSFCLVRNLISWNRPHHRLQQV